MFPLFSFIGFTGRGESLSCDPPLARVGKERFAAAASLLLFCWLLHAHPCHGVEPNPGTGTRELGEVSPGLELRHPSSPGDGERSIARLEGAAEPSIVGGSAEGTGQGRELPREWLARELRKRDGRLAVSVESVLGKSLQAGETVLVDVRDPRKFAGLRIPGSINLALHAVRTKDFLKGRPLVLLNEGYSYTGLEEECRRLREWGFNAAVLDGGLARWKERGGPMEGDALSQRDLHRVPPQVFFRERHYAHWVILDVSGPGDGGAASFFPGSIPMEPGVDAAAGVARVRAIWNQNGKTPFVAFLVVDRDGQGCERLETVTGKAGMKHVFCLEGGLQGYGRFLEQQAALLRREDSRGRTVTQCPSCP